MQTTSHVRKLLISLETVDSVVDESYAAFQKRLQERVQRYGQAFPVGIPPRRPGRPRKHPTLEKDFLKKRKRLGAALRKRPRGKLRGEAYIRDRFLVMNEILGEIKRLRKQATKREAVLEEKPVARAMEGQVQWLSDYNEARIQHGKTLARYLRDLEQAKEKKRRPWVVKKLESKVERVQDMASEFDRAHQDFVTTRLDYGNCLCPPEGQTLDQWIRANAESLGLLGVAHERTGLTGPQKAALTKAERKRIAEEKVDAWKQLPADTPYQRQLQIDALRMEIGDLERQKEKLERIQRYGGVGVYK